MDYSKKMKMLKELDSKTDWEAIIQSEIMLKNTAGKGQMKNAPQKLTKSQKKQRKLERQRQEVEQLLKTKNVETVVYRNPEAAVNKLNKDSSKKGPDNDGPDEVAPDSTPGIDIDMRQTRFEIMKFGMNSLKAKDLEDAETTLAISLGARPKKRVAVNYKDLQVQRKLQREQEQEEASTSVKPKLNAATKKKPKMAPAKGSKRDKNARKSEGRSNDLNRNSKFKRHRKQ